MKVSETKKRLMGCVIAIALAVTVDSAAAANPFKKISPEQWEEAMVISGFDSELLYAIALVESGTSFDGMRNYGPWPWVMNINNKPFFYATRTAATEALQEQLDNNNDRVAVGMFQIYLRYNAKYAKDPIDLMDPVVNMYAGAMVLRGCGKTYSTTEDILSCYHSGDVDKAGIRYAKRVIEHAKKWGKPFRMRSNLAEVKYSRSKPTRRLALDTEESTASKAVKAAVLVEKQATAQKRSISFMSSIAADQRALPALGEVSSVSGMDPMERIGAATQASARRVILVDQ